MARTPNEEQLKAIKIDGGLLLQAGAGSGKTFVIIEHVIHKIQNWITDYVHQTNSQEDFSRYIKEHLSRCVLMTFTNLAAGEMAIRLESRIKELIDQDSEQRLYWEEVFRLSHMITITTIHGFCYKLIRQGFFKNINVESKLINEDVLRLFVKDHLAAWLVKNINGKKTSRALIDKVLLQRKMFVDGVINILRDSAVLELWDNGPGADSINIWESLCLYYSSSSSFHKELLPENLKKYKWAPFIEEFQSDFDRIPETENEFKAIFDFFSEKDFKIPTARFAKDVPDDVKEKYCGIRDLKDFFKKNSNHFSSYWNDSAAWEEWDKLLKEIVENILRSYHQTNLMTFTDMEYLVWKGLEDEESQKRVAARYDYLIVDEFQDTSHMQFEIISNTVAGDYSKLFLVGDLKQAIYGFRGGEISVFKKCQEQMPHVYALKSNYRSSDEIIDFNNRFFSDLFIKHYGNEVSAEHSVTAENQSAGNNVNSGRVTLIKGDLSELLGENIESISSNDIEKIEAALIRNYIQQQKEEHRLDTAVLYRKLAPSKFLIDELAAHGIGFSTQVKIRLSEDPILAIFKVLLEGLLDTGGKHFIYSSLVINSLLSQLDIHSTESCPDQIQNFYNNTQYFGLKSAFVIFLQNLHLSIPNYKDSIGIVNQVVEHNGGDIEGVFVSLEEILQKNYSLILKFGSNSDNVTIMTTHSSKGLQYKRVIIGGIYTNDNYRPNTDLVGKIPQSFQWASSEMSKEKFKTPFYIWENENTKRREFHEAKRLFYVACTRAENELVFVDINLQSTKMKKSSVNSWANLLKNWESFDEFPFFKYQVEEKINLQIHPEIELPLFHSNNLGIVGKVGANNHCAIIPELSVTRLITSALCPKKFYFQNICKFEEGEDLFQLMDEGELEELQGPLSSKKRGTQIHESISRFIQSGFSNYDISQNNSDVLNWIGQQLSDKTDSNILISEKLMKFSFFGHMMTAIPDLYLISKKSELPTEVWDFKTGAYESHKNDHYFLQLQVYVGALANLYNLDGGYPLKMIICYVDGQKIVEKTISVKENNSDLIELWKKTQKPWSENVEHCNSCGYKFICQV